MAAALKVGRVGLDVAVTEVNRQRNRASNGRQQVTLSGWLTGTVAQVKVSRSELAAQAMLGIPIAVTYNVDSSLDGFYYLQHADIDSRVDDRSLSAGRFRFSIVLDLIGTEGQVEFQSLITSNVLANNHGLILTEVEPFLAPPIGHKAFKSNTTIFPTQRTRTTADSATDLDWYDDVDPLADPTWSCSPSTYYDGAAKVYVSSYLRAGLDAPNDPADFELSNGLVRVKPGTTGSASNGQIEIETYDGSSWDTAVVYGVYYNATSEIPAWHYTTILENTPEEVRVRLVRDANDTEGSRAHYLDISVRRGAPMAFFYYTWNGSAHNIQVRRAANEAATAITPTGAASTPGIRATDNDASGNRYVMCCPSTQTQDLTNGRIQKSAATTMAFMLGAEIGGTGAATGDTAAVLMSQYLAWVSEQVRAVRR